MSNKKPTLEDLIRLICKVRARFAKEKIMLRVTIESYAIDDASKSPPAAKQVRS